MANLFSWKGKITRKPFIITGLLLFALKYNLDRFMSIAFINKPWFITDYFIQSDNMSVAALSEKEINFFILMIIMAIPFIWIGTFLCLKRLRDAALPLWLVVFFFIPFINLCFFLLLSVMPSSEREQKVEHHKNYWFDRLIPKSRWGSAAMAVGLSAIFAAGFAAFSVNGLREYGWGVFIGIPFFIGVGSTLIHGYHQSRSFKESMMVAFLSLLLLGVLVFLLAVEGFLCILMAAPIAALIVFMGAVLGYSIQYRTSPMVLFSIALFVPFMNTVEYIEKREAPLIAVKTSIVVNRPASVVWKHLVAFSEISAPEEWLFKTGVAYPLRAKIDGCGVGATRECIFTTGAFIEPIQVWDEPRLLKFSVIDQPPPMVEWSFYDKLHAPHLEGYFTSEQGQFLLTEITPDKTVLEGTTWYRHRIWPAIYWKQWSDFILHRIHLRVLNHIKIEAEK